MTNYSFATSLPPYQEAPNLKKRQADEILLFINKGANNLLQLSQLTGLPQSTIAGRCNDLIQESKIEYKGNVIYADRKRKNIVAVKRIIEGKQSELFNQTI